MSAFTAAPFGKLAPFLWDYGYRPVPIKPQYKFPGLDDWQGAHPPDHYLPYRDPVTGRLTDCSRWGTGILTATCPAVDLDIRDKELVRVLMDVANEVLGHTPFRIGSPPKALLPYSTSEPFDKMTGRWWALPGENWTSQGYNPHRVEVLGRGQQFVAFARHPSTKLPYRWRKGCPMEVLRVDLPEINATSAKAFLAAVHIVARDLGAVALRKVSGQWQPCSWDPSDVGEPEPEPGQFFRSRGNSTDAGDRTWQRRKPEDLAKAIDRGSARPLIKSGGWIVACPAHKSEGARSLSITPRDGGGSVVHCFAECSFADISAAINAKLGGAS